MRPRTLALLALSLVACSKIAATPTAKEVADKLVADGILADCQQTQPKAFTARASEVWKCELPSVPGKQASVMAFADADAYEATVKAFEAAAALLAGGHRYGNAKARIFVQMNQDAPLEVGQKGKAIIDGL